MAEQPGGEKTLPASPRKRQRAREEGNVPKSQDLSAALMLLVALLALRYLAPMALESLVAACRHFLGGLDDIVVSRDATRSLALEATYWVARIMLPLMAILLVVGVAVSAAQVGLLVAPKVLAPKWDRLNPLTGLARFASARTAMELVKSILKLSVVTALVYFAVRDRWEELLLIMHTPPLGIVSVIGGLTVAIWWRVVLAMLVIGILDYGFQRWQYERDLMMTQKEAREEAKEMEGDPRIKQRIRQIQRQVAMQRMMKEVPKADVIITNPTHYAVALRYEAATMQAPTVVAKGMRLLAQRIRQTGVEHNVPIVERPELARALYKAVEIGQSVPEDLFRAVAEVLAFVYRIDRRAEKIRERAQQARPQPAPGMRRAV